MELSATKQKLPASATIVAAIDTRQADQPVLINKYVNKKDIFLTTYLIQKESLLFFFSGKDLIISFSE